MRYLSFAAIGLALLLIGWFVVEGEEPRAPRDEAVEQLIERLGSEDYKQREAATQELEALGDRPLALLREAVEHSENAEIRWRAHKLLAAPKRQSRASGLELVLIPAGEFQQGSPPNEQARWEDEVQHRVSISRSFYLGVHEVSQEEYRLVMKRSPSWFSATGDGKAKVGGMDTGRFPVERVSWFDALAFCNELSKLDQFQPYYELSGVEEKNDSIVTAKVKVRGGHGYRLPSEAEWEYSCRARTTTPYHYGAATNGALANVRGVTIPGGYGGEIKGPNLQRTCARGSYGANAFGLFDMHGNVGEWCFDNYEKEYYQAAPRRDPPGPAESPHRVWRGGSWIVIETSCRSAQRNFHTPDERKEYLGFRVARNP